MAMTWADLLQKYTEALEERDRAQATCSELERIITEESPFNETAWFVPREDAPGYVVRLTSAFGFKHVLFERAKEVRHGR
jgi:hypothetical protein